jgi:prepilin-type processing-associated H-X9-DG protein
VFAKAREKARQASCASNLKQIGIAFNMYAQDYDETYVLMSNPAMTIHWIDLLKPYTSGHKIAQCPSNSDGSTIWVGDIGYGYNFLTFGYDSDATSIGWYNGPARVGDIQSPSETIAFEDANNAYTYPPSTQVAAPADLNTQYTAVSGIDPRHSNGTNMAFADGHVKWMNIGQIARHGGNPASGQPFRGMPFPTLADNWFDRN